jgi:hypothetical protein
MSGILAAVSQRELWDEARIKFWSEPRIKQMVADSVDKDVRALYPHEQARTAAGDAGDLRARLLFATGKQRTWLITDSLMVFCVLDDRRREEPRILWKSKLQDALPVSADETWSEEAGVLHFGNRTKGWLYSKNLFSQEPVEVAISRFLSGSATDLAASGQT